MSDIRSLLRTAAAEPVQPVDLVSLHRRAVRPSWRRRLGLLAGAVGVAAVAAVPSWTALSPAGEGTRVEVDGPREPALVEVAADESADSGSPRPDPPKTTPNGSRLHAEPSTSGGSIASVPAATVTTTTWNVPPDTDGCRTEPGLGWSTENGGFGWDSMYDLECSYDARRPGGYRAAGVWRITIERDGTTILLESTTSPACGPTGTFERGDKVTATVRTGGVSTEDSYVEVGDDVHC